ncbi:reverse transcriptase/maturase family protein [Limosilactobacillus reuteri]|uniref:reverse transcriptase/maturase family protein n=1 Tax=Limosilactobacillus reuteri TaxID=1598 RepID=UPI00080CB79F|nr:reverse transcriptase/maturase family protein [Limosilactobacillus reuteri]ANU51420.1 hypothetical protein A4V07_03725 [Limosilactobacillus reuteri]OXE59102.1 hypothetical protein ADH69_00180 [Limosilactobacillus reuteri]QQR14637.1 group II intron reverse transcriptase domain-containing protein [Limosilactobacillus reuteri]
MEKNISFSDIRVTVLKKCCKKDELEKMTTTYKHFDKPLSNNIKRKIIKEILRDNNYVARYRHLPFIEFPIAFQKYSRKRKRYEKKRIISLPSHHDAFLYKVYSKLLSECYEIYLRQKGLSEVPLAYRKGHSNITGAKEAIDKMSTQDSWVIKGDFSHFFDNLNHDVLLKNVKKVIRNINGGEFSNDWLRLLRNLMNYRYINLEDISKEITSNHNRISYINSLSELDSLLKNDKLKVSKKHKVGIPQGTALSAVLANIYMIEFDEWVRDYLRQFDGFYRRYSDDFIVIIPKQQIETGEIGEVEEKIIDKSRDKLSLIIKKEKTHLFYYSKQDKKVYLYSSDKRLHESELNYLGFSFNGMEVNVRPKTIYKFRYRGKKAINKLVENISIYRQIQNSTYNMDNDKLNGWQKYVKESAEKGYAIPKRRQYTKMYLISHPVKRKNFLSYAFNAEKIFSENSGNYKVNILKPALRQVGYLQRNFNKERVPIK